MPDDLNYNYDEDTGSGRWRLVNKQIENDRKVYSGLPEETKAICLALSEVVRGKAAGMMRHIAMSRKEQARLPMENPTEVVDPGEMELHELIGYAYLLGMEAGVKTLAGRLYDFMTGGALRCWEDEGAPQNPRFIGEGAQQIVFPQDTIRPSTSQAPAYTPPLKDHQSYAAAAKYMGIPERALTTVSGTRRDDNGGVVPIPGLSPAPEPAKTPDEISKMAAAIEAKTGRKVVIENKGGAHMLRLLAKQQDPKPENEEGENHDPVSV